MIPMEENSVVEELAKALSGIQAELQQMNKTLSILAAQSKLSTGEPDRRPPQSFGRSTPSAGRFSARGPKNPGYTGYKRPDAGDDYESPEREPGSRFSKPKGPGRPKGKLPPKKGGGYPKKPR